jgi:radical SAM superfamily enzyme YgiQ (UPF0313 family)
MSKPAIWFADLTHTAQGISSATFPLGVSYVMSYAMQELGAEFDFRLFKFPADLEQAISAQLPQMLCFSNYSWNFELGYKMASLAKQRDRRVVTVFGGPNFPVDLQEKTNFLAKRPAIDFYVELEGELGFVDLTRKLANHGFDVAKLKNQRESGPNTNYLIDNQLVCGSQERVGDINVIPSPYLTGVMDEFFDLPLVPMIETTRGCPFSCSFCADGLDIKSKVFRYNEERVREELRFIASRVKDVDELIVTDLNFAMYKEDLLTAKAIAGIQQDYRYPKLVSASAGKNKPNRTIEVASMISGWTLGASIQSTDPVVLKAIKRSNISSSAYQELVKFGNSVDISKTHSEIILGLPEDTRDKHFESLRFGIDSNVNSIRMFQAMLLTGTDMATPASRRRYGYKTKFRTIPGCVGFYEFFGDRHPVAEIEEIIVGSNTLSIDDYVDCRVMNLVIETFYNNAMFDEVYAMLRTVGVSPFDCLVFLKEHPDLRSPKVTEIISAFIDQTSNDLYDSFDEARDLILTPEIVERYVGGELGTNELLLHRALLFSEFEDICELLFTSVEEVLRSRGLLSEKVANYLGELQRFTVLRKKDLFSDTGSTFETTFKYDFEVIRESEFEIDPDSFPVSDIPQEFRFYHSAEQQQHIGNQVRIYADTPIGLGRLIQRSNLKAVYRSFVKPASTLAPVD